MTRRGLVLMTLVCATGAAIGALTGGDAGDAAYFLLGAITAVVAFVILLIA